MEKVLVVDVTARGSGRRLSTLDVIGVGPRLVTALLKSHGANVELLPYERVIGGVVELQDYDVLALSFMASDVGAVNKVLRLWRGGLVMLGGPGTLDEGAMKAIPFHVAVVGEAEVPIGELMRRYRGLREAYEEIVRGGEPPRGVLVKRPDGTLIGGGIAPWAPKEALRLIPEVEALKNYPFHWASRVYVEAVRGCSNFRRPRELAAGLCRGCGGCGPGPRVLAPQCPAGLPPGCAYCNVPLIHGPPRSRDSATVVREVELLLRLGVTRVVLSAPDFLDYGREELVEGPLTDPCEPKPNLDRIEELLRGLTRLAPVADGAASIMVENVKPCLVTEDVAELLGRYLRDTPVYVGLESCSERLLKLVGRPSTHLEALRALRLLKKHGLRPYVYLMHGLPVETPEDVKITASRLQELEMAGVERVVLYRFRPLPRTALASAPPPRPAVADPARRELYLRVREFNERRKAFLVGTTVTAVVASRHPRRGLLVAYPLPHGPVVLLRASSRFIGCVVRVRIVRALSERLVMGELLHSLRRVAPKPRA